MTSTPIQSSMRMIEWVLLITLSVLWGSSFFFVEIALQVLPPLSIVAFRLFIAAIMLHLILYFKKLRMPYNLSIWRDFLFIGLLNNIIPFLLIAWGQLYISSSLAAIIIANVPIFTVIFAHCFTDDEKFKITSFIGVLLGIAGIIIMFGDALTGLNKNILGQLAVLGACVSYAYSNIFARKFSKKNTPILVSATGQITVGGLILMPLALIIDRPWQLASTINLETILSILGLSLFSSVFAYIIYFRIIKMAGAINLSLTAFLIPVSSIILGVGLLQEVLEIKHLAGMGFIALGLLIIDGRVLKLLKKNKIT